MIIHIKTYLIHTYVYNIKYIEILFNSFYYLLIKNKFSLILIY